MNKRHKNVVSLVERRAAERVKHDARARYQRTSATIDLHRQTLLRVTRERARLGDVTVPPRYRRFLPENVRVRTERAGWPGEAPHSITVEPVEGGKFRARCTCGTWLSKPMGHSHAKGAGTRHVRLSEAAAAGQEAA